MANSRPIDAAQVRTALAPVLGWLASQPSDTATPAERGEPSQHSEPDRRTLGGAVRTTLRAFAQRHPGKAVEVRVPPFAAVQCLAGGAHTRGTPPHVVETDALSWLLLVTGLLDWDTAIATARVQASGHRSGEIGPLLPLAIAIFRDVQ